MNEQDHASVQSFLVFILHHLEHDHENEEARREIIHELKQVVGLDEPKQTRKQKIA